MSRKKITVLTGAGISAESGIKTFRDADGLWEGHDVQQVATPEGWQKDQRLVLKFYNERRRLLKDVKPNYAHLALVELERAYDVTVVTQNIDNLHEKAGSSHIIHLHGELLKARSTIDVKLIYDWVDDINIGDQCEKGSQLRPHVVWFGEDVPMFLEAAKYVHDADIIIIVGTSMQVYPAASLVTFAQSGARIFYIDPNPNLNYELQLIPELTVIPEVATLGLKTLLRKLMD